MWVFKQSYLHGEVPLREVSLLLLLLLGDACRILWRQTAADGASLLGTKIEWQVLLFLVEETELGALVGVDDGEHASDRFADVVAIEYCHVSDWPFVHFWVRGKV